MRKLLFMPANSAACGVVACVGADDRAPYVVRAAAILANSLGVHWVALYVESPRLARIAPALRERVLAALRMADEAGAESMTLGALEVADSVLQFARTRGAGHIVVGRPHWRRGWRRLTRTDAEAIISGSAGIAVYVVDDSVPVDAAAMARYGNAVAGLGRSDRPFGGHWRLLPALALVALATVIGLPLHGVSATATMSMLYLLAVATAGALLGRLPAMLAALAAALSFNFFFTQPQRTLRIDDPRELLTFAALLSVGLLVASLSAHARHQARVALQREERAVAIGAFAEALLGAENTDSIRQLTLQFVGSAFDAEVELLYFQPQHTLQFAVSPDPGSLGINEQAVRWVLTYASAAGIDTQHFSHLPAHYAPIRTPFDVVAVLVVQPRDPRRLLLPEPRRTLATYLRQLALAIERVRMTRQAEAAQSAVQLESQRNALLSGLSHDLRTPLTTIVGASSAILLGHLGLPESTRDLVQTIQESSQRMSRLTNNLLAMTRLADGAVKLNAEWVPVEEMLGSVRRQLRDALSGREIKVSIDPPNLSAYVDAVLIEQVIVNLLDNAIKYSGAERPLEIACFHGNGQRETVEIRVMDRGFGVPPELKAKVFEKFVRGQFAGLRTGAGIGLALCQTIVGLHRGDIHMKDRDGGGTELWVSLPQPPQGAPCIAIESDS
jgi:two-component system sensor histidine kinase KdpD